MAGKTKDKTLISKPGRPKAKIDWLMVGERLKAGVKGTLIAGDLGIDVETLYNRCKEDNSMGFSEFSALKKAHGDECLHERQYLLAMMGNVPMLIWLGKVRLGQKEEDGKEEKTNIEVKLFLPTTAR